ncbi:MAG: hypothetical protein CM1200mP20_14350 [Pseudomonadota bacterium]|nr:MAG: hypothetical protein CM1200mP20_14350 [Pseudomonadota bacterium]
MIEPGEKPIETAKRELREETGLEAADWKPLGSTLPSPGFCSEELFLFRATGLPDVGARPDAENRSKCTTSPFLRSRRWLWMVQYEMQKPSSRFTGPHTGSDRTGN